VVWYSWKIDGCCSWFNVRALHHIACVVSCGLRSILALCQALRMHSDQVMYCNPRRLQFDPGQFITRISTSLFHPGLVGFAQEFWEKTRGLENHFLPILASICSWPSQRMLFRQRIPNLHRGGLLMHLAQICCEMRRSSKRKPNGSLGLV